MNNYKSEFITWYFNEFPETALFRGMSNVTEDSPHHREADVGTHTNMVMGQFLTMTNNSADAWFDLIGAFACAFHDVGKPHAMEVVFSEERGEYRRFRGHELLSARLWEDWAVANWTMLKDRFGFEPHDIYRVGWIVENHLPWGIKKPAKRRVLALTVGHICGYAEPFNVVLKADTWGRISDDQIEKRTTVEAWCNDFDVLVNSTKYDTPKYDADVPNMYMLIGASGSGKSTYMTEFGWNIITYSWDSLRLEWYDKDDYANAFKLACEDKEFMNKAHKAFEEQLATGKDVAVDNVNTSKKRRANYIQKARQYGYNCVAVLFPVELQTILDRQESRVDKSVPAGSVERQYMSIGLPSIGEFDKVVVHAGNLK